MKDGRGAFGASQHLPRSLRSSMAARESIPACSSGASSGRSSPSTAATAAATAERARAQGPPSLLLPPAVAACGRAGAAGSERQSEGLGLITARTEVKPAEGDDGNVSRSKYCSLKDSEITINRLNSWLPAVRPPSFHESSFIKPSSAVSTLFLLVVHSLQTQPGSLSLFASVPGADACFRRRLPWHDPTSGGSMRGQKLFMAMAS